MYKILLLKRASDQIWIYYKTTDESGESIDFQTDNITELEDKIKELLLTIPKNQIKPIQDMQFVLDVIIENGGVIV